MALFIRPQIPMLISSSHADLKSCTPQLVYDTPETEILKNILRVCARAWPVVIWFCNRLIRADSCQHHTRWPPTPLAAPVIINNNFCGPYGSGRHDMEPSRGSLMTAVIHWPTSVWLTSSTSFCSIINITSKHVMIRQENKTCNNWPFQWEVLQQRQVIVQMYRTQSIHTYYSDNTLIKLNKIHFARKKVKRL